jgi:hypothetical protein
LKIWHSAGVVIACIRQKGLKMGKNHHFSEKLRVDGTIKTRYHKTVTNCNFLKFFCKQENYGSKVEAYKLHGAGNRKFCSDGGAISAQRPQTGADQ